MQIFSFLGLSSSEFRLCQKSGLDVFVLGTDGLVSCMTEGKLKTIQDGLWFVFLLVVGFVLFGWFVFL